jgi:hypothetical protein
MAMPARDVDSDDRNPASWWRPNIDWLLGRDFGDHGAAMRRQADLCWKGADSVIVIGLADLDVV